MDDIRRLKKELFWVTGKCAYCNGIGKVPAGRIEKIGADLEYLTINLPSWERYKLINGDKEAMKRAIEHKQAVQRVIEDIVHLYYIENKEPLEIAEALFHKQGLLKYTDAEKKELIAYVEKVIKIKQKN